jgi:hypothetical protein
LFAEEIDELENIGGLSSVEHGLCTSFSKGLKGDDFHERNILYGNNLKPVVALKSYLQLLLTALEVF